MATTTEHLISAIGDIKAAEAEAEHIKADARTKAEHILRKAKEDAQALSRRAHDELVTYKDSRTRERHAETDAQVDLILQKARKEAQRIHAHTLDKKELALLVQFILQD